MCLKSIEAVITTTDDYYYLFQLFKYVIMSVLL